MWCQYWWKRNAPREIAALVRRVPCADEKRMRQGMVNISVTADVTWLQTQQLQLGTSYVCYRPTNELGHWSYLQVALSALKKQTCSMKLHRVSAVMENKKWLANDDVTALHFGCRVNFQHFSVKLHLWGSRGGGGGGVDIISLVYWLSRILFHVLELGLQLQLWDG